MKYLFIVGVNIIGLIHTLPTAFSQKIVVRKGSTIYTANTPKGEGVYEIKKHVAKKNFKTSDLNIHDDHTTLDMPSIDNFDSNSVMEKNFTGITDFTSNYNNTKDPAFFPYPSITTDEKLKIKTTLGKWKLSAATITARRRSAISKSSDTYREENNIDEPPVTWQTGFSPGLAATKELIKWTNYANGFSSNSISVNIGPVISFNTQDIKGSTTLNRVTFDRKALSLTYGAILNIDINKFDMGAFFGWESATGEGANNWIYQGVPHFGFLIGYEIIKPK